MMAVLGADRLIRKLGNLPPGLQRPIQDALDASVEEMLGYAVVRIQRASGGGRTYRRGGRTHTASAPGEFPNTDHGQLVGSMDTKKGPLSASWIVSARYAKWLEYGTSRMAARPFMRPTFRALRQKASDRVGRAVADALRSYSRGR